MKQILTVLIALMVFALVACEGPAGPAGVAGQKGDTGTPGVNAGFVYFEGFKDSLRCASCHTPDADTTKFLLARRLEYESAGHMEGTAWARGINSTTCASCHITEGYLEMARGNYVSQATKTYGNGTPPGCFTCHSPHAKGDFSLRKTDAINVKSFVAGAPDVSFNVGTANTCVTCHRTRETSPMSPIPDPTKTAATDSIVITSNRFYPHYGVQGQILMGEGGFEFTGYTYASSYHTTLANAKNIQCADCHMATPVVVAEGKAVAGGHTLKMGYFSSSTDTVGSVNVAGCRDAACHASDITANTMTRPNFEKYRTAQQDVEHGLDSLRTLLINKGWLVASSNLANASSSKPLVIKPAYKAGALFNFFFLEHEGSHGIHNTKYAKALLDASIAELNK
ncbi:MAG: hypothetical protein HYV29_03575 [Ignavibacteriales bacterium]|nr:hypothetical protein [Ignavibacteriales bacterium]